MGSGEEDYRDKALSFITANPIVPSIPLITADVDLDHLAKARFLHCKVILSYPLSTLCTLEQIHYVQLMLKESEF